MRLDSIHVRAPKYPSSAHQARVPPQQSPIAAIAAKASMSVPSDPYIHSKVVALAQPKPGELPKLSWYQSAEALIKSIFQGLPFKSDSQGRLVIQGTSANDRIEVRPAPGGHAWVTVNGETWIVPKKQAQSMLIQGGAGNDSIIVDSQFPYGVQINGQDGNDFIQGGAGDDRLIGGKGDDYILGYAGIDIIEGNEGRDTLRGGAGNDTLLGGGGNDYLDGDQGNDVLNGGAGDDQIQDDEGKNVAVGGGGKDMKKAS